MSNIVTSDLTNSRPRGSLSGYNPAILVMDVQRILTERGVRFSSVEHPNEGSIMLARTMRDSGVFRRTGAVAEALVLANLSGRSKETTATQGR